MTTLVTADEKRRLCIRGAAPGKRYLVQQSVNGWYITPVGRATEPATRNQREWDPPSDASLWDELEEMGKLGLRIEPSKESKRSVPPCRF